MEIPLIEELKKRFIYGERYATYQTSKKGRYRENIWVYDDGVVKGFIQVEQQEVKKLFVEPVLQGNSIGSELLKYAITEKAVNSLWALEKNTKAIAFYQRHGFEITKEKKYEEGTTEFLVLLQRRS